MRTLRLPLFVSLLWTLALPAARAEAADSAANGFTVKILLLVAAQPETVYNKLVRNVGDWWSPQHTFSGDAHNLRIEEKPMGCFCEKLANGGGVRHLEVVHIAPGKEIVMTGALGPLQSIAASGSMMIQVGPSKLGARLDVTYSVAGYLPKGFESWAGPVDKVLTEQFTRLKTYIETGKPQL